MCKSVTLYGHLTVDRILVGFKETPSLGGIANVWSGLVSQGQGLNVSIQPLSIGHALVLVDKENNYIQTIALNASFPIGLDRKLEYI